MVSLRNAWELDRYWRAIEDGGERIYFPFPDSGNAVREVQKGIFDFISQFGTDPSVDLKALSDHFQGKKAAPFALFALPVVTGVQGARANHATLIHAFEYWGSDPECEALAGLLRNSADAFPPV